MGVGAGWYYDSLDGNVIHQNFFESLPNAAFSYYHGPYPTEAAAIAHKGVAGPPGVPNESVSTQVGTAAGSAAAGVLGIPHFTSSALRGYAIRAFKIVAGIVLVIIGVFKITGAPQKAAALAVTAGKVVP